jgi:hypothetical protein
VTALADVDRAVLERYLADLHAEGYPNYPPPPNKAH